VAALEHDPEKWIPIFGKDHAQIVLAIAGQRAGGEIVAHTFVLVHGAWHGGWCWRRVADRLRGTGHLVFTPTLTGLGERSHLLRPDIDINVHVADVANLIKWERLKDVILCGHSYGGFVISGVAEQMARANRSLFLLDAFLPSNGDTIQKLTGPAVQDAIRGAVQRGDSGVAPRPAAAFGVNETDRQWVDALCVPQPIGTFTSPITLTGARDRIALKTYVRAKNYGNTAFDGALAAVQSDPSWRCHELPCGHDVMIDMPERLSELLLQAAA
jgi:pimeloyl-ACP methyl ester carboxylesterase